MTTRQRATADDLMALPDDSYLHELVRGEIIRMPPPKEGHGYAEAALVEAIGRYLHDRALALGWLKSQGGPHAIYSLAAWRATLSSWASRAQPRHVVGIDVLAVPEGVLPRRTLDHEAELLVEVDGGGVVGVDR